MKDTKVGDNKGSDTLNTMSIKELKEMIDIKVLEAKIDVCEKRLHFILYIAGSALTVLGIIVPILIVNRSSEKVDFALQRMEDKMNESARESSIKAEGDTRRMENKIEDLSEKSSSMVENSIRDMEDRFEVLAGKQLRKPKVECFFEGRQLYGRTLNFSLDNEYIEVNIEVKNVGDGVAEHISFWLYMGNPSDNIEKILEPAGTLWSISKTINNKKYSALYIHEVTADMASFIPSQGALPLRLHFTVHKIGSNTIPVCLKIFYGEPNPIEIPFSLVINRRT